MASNTANFSIRLPDETKDRIEALAKALGRPRNYVITEAIERYLQEESWQLAEIQAALEEDAADQALPHEDVLSDAYAAIDAAARRGTST